MLNYLSEYELFPTINIILQLTAIVFFSMFMVGFTIKKLIQFMKG